MAQKVLLKKSSVQNKVPYAPGVEFGELAVNYASGTGKAFLATKKYDGSMATFHEDDYNSATYATKDSVSPIAADVAGIKSNYVTKAQLNTTSGAAVNSAYTMAVNYINSAISGMSIGDYLTVDSATSVFNTLESRLGAFALSATVKNEISALTATLEDDEYVIAQALNDHESRLNEVEGMVEGLDGNFLTVESAASVFSTLEANTTAARNKAESAYTYASIISGSVYSKTETDSRIATVAVAAGSARTYTNTVSGLIVTSLSSAISDVNDDVQANAASISTIQNRLNAFALSATVNSMIGEVNDTILDNETVTAAALTDLDARIRSLSGSVGSDYATSEDIDTLNQSITTLGNKLSAVSGTVKNTYWTSATTKQKIDAAVTSAYTAAVASANNYTNTLSGNVHNAIQTINSNLTGYVTTNTLQTISASKVFSSAITLSNGYMATTAASFTNSYRTIPFASTTAVNHITYVNSNANSGLTYNPYTGKLRTGGFVINGKTAGDLLTADGGTMPASSFAASGVVATAQEGISTLNNKVNAITSGYAASAVVKTTYWTSATTKQKIDAAVTSAYTASTSVTKTLSGNVVTAISTVNEGLSTANDRITAVSAIVTNNYATEAEASEFAAAALGNAMAYTDSKIQDIAIGDYLTRASAGTMYNTLNQKITTASGSLVSLSGNIVSNYWNATTTQSKINEASAYTYNKAVSAANSYAKAISGTMESNFNTVNQKITATSGSLVSFSASVKSLLSTVYTYKGSVANYASLPASGEVEGYVYNVVAANGTPGQTGYTPAGTNYAWNGSAWDPLGGTVDMSWVASSAIVQSGFDTIDESISESNNRITAVSAVVTNNYATNAKASSYAAAALSNAMDYTDSKIQDISICDYLTMASAGTMYNTLNESISTKATDTAVVHKVGDTMTGNLVFNVGANGYVDSYASSGINLNNSNIVGVNSIYTKDASENAQEGIHFYRDATHVDTIWAASGKLNFTPNRQLTTNGTTYEVYHTGNLATGNFATTAVTEAINSDIAVLNNKVSAITSGYALSAVVKTTYWTSATTKEKIDAAVTSAYTASTAVTKALSGNVVDAIDVVDSSIRTLSGNVVSAMSDNEEVISAALNELHTEIENLESTVTSYSDSLDVLPNSYLTVASANSIVNTLNSNITSNSNQIEQLTTNSGTMNTTLNKINGSYVSAVSFTTGATDASITNNTMTIPKPKVLTITKNGTNLATYDGMTAVTAATTDASVKQSQATGNYYRGLLLSNLYTTTATAGPTGTTTAETYVNSGIYANPSTGIIYAKGFSLTGASTNILLANGTSLAQSTFSTTDKKVEQVSSTAEERRALVLGSTTAATGTALATTTVTAGTAFNKDIYAIPSTGELNSKQVRINEKVTLQYNASTEALDFIFS